MIDKPDYSVLKYEYNYIEDGKEDYAEFKTFADAFDTMIQHSCKENLKISNQQIVYQETGDIVLMMRTIQ